MALTQDLDNFLRNYPASTADKEQYKEAVLAGTSRIAGDYNNGARVLAKHAVTSLIDILPPAVSCARNGGSLFGLLRFTGRCLCLARESMGSAITTAILRALRDVRLAFEKHASAEWAEVSDTTMLESHADQSIKETLQALEKSNERLSSAFVHWIKSKISQTPGLGSQDRPLRILTLSASSSLKACLSAALEDISSLHLDLRVLESRPRCEGVNLASHFATCAQKDRMSVEVGTDASVALLARNVDVVILGADRISANGDVSNKTGSLPAAIVAKHLNPNVQVVVVSETDKIAKPGEMSEHKEEENDPSEVTRIWEVRQEGVKGMRVRNVYFEWVEAGLVDAFITEMGILEREKIKERADFIEKEELEFFTFT